MSIVYFELPETLSNYSQEDSGGLVKNAIILAEGQWTDNKKRDHKFDRERIIEIASNTNRNIDQGVRVPILRDHKKDQLNVIGDLEGNVELRELTEEDLPKGKFKNLIGKLAIVTKGIVIKAKSAIEQCKEGLLETISPGIDIKDNIIREISVTPTPAIPGMRLFSRFNREENMGLKVRWEDIEKNREEVEEVLNELDDLHDKFKELIESILTTESFEIDNKDELLLEAVKGYMIRLVEELDIQEKEDSEEYEQTKPSQFSRYSSRIPTVMEMKEYLDYMC
jgi:Fe-S-cluster formation regulator IscX/YfhJ